MNSNPSEIETLRAQEEALRPHKDTNEVIQRMHARILAQIAATEEEERVIGVRAEVLEYLEEILLGLSKLPTSAANQLKREVVATLQSDSRHPLHAEEPGPASTHSSRHQASKRRTRAAEDMTPEPAYYARIIQVLGDADGSADKGFVTREVGAMLADRLQDEDFALVSTGEPRWENKVAWARNRLRKWGYMPEKMPWGIWQLSEKGMGLYESRDWPDGWEAPDA